MAEEEKRTSDTAKDVRVGDFSCSADACSSDAAGSDAGTLTKCQKEKLEKKKEFTITTSKEARFGKLVIIALIIFCVVCALISLMLGRYPIPPDTALALIANQFIPMDQVWTEQQEALFFNVRLPRIFLALLVGCCLAAAGAAFQGTFQNPLVSPDFLGASQGAALGASIAIINNFSGLGVTVMAFVFSIISVFFVLFVSGRAKGNRILVTVLAGVMISSLLQAGVSFMKLVADPDDQLQEITFWLMGALNNASPADIQLAIIPMLIGLAVLIALRWNINILTMGDDEAATMGINAPRIRVAVILGATIVTAASVAVTGIIGWVGLVIPHLCRMLIGCDYRKLLPASMLAGGGFLLLVDNVARLATSAEIPLGILTAFVGAPFFLYLITRNKQSL